VWKSRDASSWLTTRTGAAREHGNEPPSSVTGEQFFESQNDYELFRKTLCTTKLIFPCVSLNNMTGTLYRKISRMKATNPWAISNTDLLLSPYRLLLSLFNETFQLL
jgi:hypothetical protein